MPCPLTAAACSCRWSPAGRHDGCWPAHRHLLDHAGVCFRRRFDPGDRDAVAAAAQAEEIGLPGERVAVIGRLDAYVAPVEVTPVVGLIDELPVLAPDPRRPRRSVPLAFRSTRPTTGGTVASMPARPATSTPCPGGSITSGARPPACW
jgi:hypothetical protein